LWGAGVSLGHGGSYALEPGTGMDAGAVALWMDIQNIHAQQPLSVGLSVLRSGRSYDTTIGLDVFFGAILDEVGERLTGVQLWE
jgi:hypothetical protein